MSSEGLFTMEEVFQTSFVEALASFMELRYNRGTLGDGLCHSCRGDAIAHRPKDLVCLGSHILLPAHGLFFFHSCFVSCMVMC